jgi:hypothetical protein
MQTSGQSLKRQHLVQELEPFFLQLGILQQQLFDLRGRFCVRFFLILADLTIRWLAVSRQLLLDGRFLGKSRFLRRAGVQPGAAGLSVVAGFI